MTQTTLDKYLNNLDAILILDGLDNDEIVRDLDRIRSYIIDLSMLEKNKNKDENFKNIVMVIIQFINYMINLSIAGASTGCLPMSFFNQINALRRLIIMFELGVDFNFRENIDFNEECDDFIKKYINIYFNQQ